MNRQTLISLVLSITVLAGAGAAYFITFNVVSQLQEESFLLQKEIKASLDKEERINRAERTLSLIESQEKTIFEYLVSEETIVDFLETLEGIEEETNVALDIVSVGAGEESVFNINLTIEGSFKNVMKTLSAIEKLPVFIGIESGTIETILREGDTKEIWTASASYSVKQK
ncbi:hypothetical protein COB87_000865 [Candidatus Wolfebacteria bacterium]|nr:hypothetical protein [Candidatus Wolfebacteria bacterium]